MNEIRYWVHDWDTYSGGPPDGATPEQTPHYFEVVRASDFDALRAEVERLRALLKSARPYVQAYAAITRTDEVSLACSETAEAMREELSRAVTSPPDVQTGSGEVNAHS